MNCPFCDENVIKNQSIFETENEYVIYNRSPANKGQCVVVPKRHVENIRELTDKEAESLFKIVKMVSEKLNEHLKSTGFNYGINEGSYAGQRVFHFHFHILPRFENDAVSNYHLFHRKSKDKIILTEEEMNISVEEFRKIFLY